VSRYDGPANGQDEATAISLDRDANILVTGRSWGSGTYMDYATVKYRPSDGKQLWARRFGTAAGWDTPVGIGTDALGNVHVAGTSLSESTGHDYATLKYSPAGQKLWEERYAGMETLSDMAAGIAVDAAGNVYVTGVSFRTDTAQDFATVAYSRGGSLLWEQRYNGSYNGTDEPVGVGVDSKGGVYVAGTSAASVSDLGDYTVVKYSATDGAVAWARRYDKSGSLFEIARAMAVNADGDVAVTGICYDSSFMADSDVLTVKYDAAGARLWARSYNGAASGYDYPESVAMDPQGNVYVAGESADSSYSTNYLALKYDATGRAWTRTYSGQAKREDMAQAVAVDGDGNVYVTGFSEGVDSVDAVTAKYSPVGLRLWAKRYSVPGRYNGAKAIAVDKVGNVYIAGDCYSESNSVDYLTIKYGPDGTDLWVERYDGPGNGEDSAKALVVDDDGNVYVTGRSQGVTSADYATVKYSATGTEQWVKRYDGPGAGWDGAVALVLDHLGDLYVTGTSYGGKATAYDYATIRYRASDGAQVWAQRFNGGQ
jgi:uncharacterized delta-60 repeat protein